MNILNKILIGFIVIILTLIVISLTHHITSITVKCVNPTFIGFNQSDIPEGYKRCCFGGECYG
jgi:hypothetical protein